MSDIDDEIRRIQQIRETQKNILFQQDNDDKDQYDNVIETNNDKDKKKKKKEKRKEKDKKKKKRKSRHEDEDENEDDNNSSRVVAREFESYNIPKSVLNSVPVNEDDDSEILRSKYNLPQTVASKEDEYRSRWRKRSLEPISNYDPFTGKGDQTKHKSYGEIMSEQNLLREEKEVMEKIRKIQDKEKEKQRQIKVNQELNNNNDYNTDHEQPQKKFKSENVNEKKWIIKVFKDKKIVKEINIELNRTMTLGRDPNRNLIVLEHESCSSTHATIRLNDKRPILIDLNSTNQTILNDKAIRPQQPQELYQGDTIQFGGSTREYIIFFE